MSRSRLAEKMDIHKKRLKYSDWDVCIVWLCGFACGIVLIGILYGL